MKEKFRLDNETGEFVPVLDGEGREIPDPTPMAPPIGFKRQAPLHERIRAMVQHEFHRSQRQAAFESPEEADDFIIPDEDDPREGRFAMLPGHEWEENYEPPKTFDEMRDRLISAGWSPPKKGQENSAEKPSKGDAETNSLDASKAGETKGAGAKPA